MELAIWCSRTIKYAPIYANITQYSNLSLKYMFLRVLLSGLKYDLCSIWNELIMQSYFWDSCKLLSKTQKILHIHTKDSSLLYSGSLMKGSDCVLTWRYSSRARSWGWWDRLCSWTWPLGSWAQQSWCPPWPGLCLGLVPTGSHTRSPCCSAWKSRRWREDRREREMLHRKVADGLS